MYTPGALALRLQGELCTLSSNVSVQMNKFIRNEAELLIPHVAGGVYYRDLARERARLRNCVIDENNHHNSSANNVKATHASLRKPRYVARIKKARRPPSVKPRTVKALKKALNVLRETQQMAEKRAYIQVSYQ